MYPGSDRKFYFAGENIVQDMHQTAPGFTGNRPSIKDSSYYDSFGGTPTKSVQIRDPEYDIFDSHKKSTFKRELETPKLAPLPPRDLGENFVQVLLDEFKRVRQINTKDPKVLLDFWKQNRKSRQKDSDALNRSLRQSGRGDKSFMSQGSQTSDRLKDLQNIAKEREEDVAYTLEVHSQLLHQEENMKKFIIDAYRQRKMEEDLKKNQKPKKMSKETLDRLYKAPPPKAERPSSAQSTQARSTQNSMKNLYDRDFVQKLVDLYAETRPMEKRHLDSNRLFIFWQTLPNKHENRMNKKESAAREDIQSYFDEKYDTIEEVYESKYGYKTYDHKVLTNFHKTEVSEAEKKKKDIDYDSVSLEKQLEKYCAQRKKENDELEKQREEQRKKKEEEEKARLARAVIKKDVKATGLKDLAKPKDNLQKGKTMLFLKKMFPNDRILQRMILNEFKKNKLLKHPEEYDVYDSDEEIDIYQRDEQKEPFKTASKEGRLLQIKDFNKSIYAREKDITKPFAKYLEQKYLDSNLKVEDEKHQKTKEQREEKQLNRFIASRVRRYVQMKQKRLDEKIPSLKEFLIQTYREMRHSFKGATKRRFPHITYGYSKRLKVNSYPVEFKWYFFLLVRAASRTKMSKAKSLLPFWAPPSAGSKANVFLDTNKSYNRRVNDLSKENKLKKIEEDYDKTSCWQKEEFFLSRLSIMMNLSDAKECTFTPNVGSKMPNKHKELMHQEYAAWASQYLNVDKSSFDQWVNSIGTNLSRRFPAIYKYGRFKKALRYWKEEQYIKSYKEIAEAFNLDQIKKYYDPTYNPEKNKSVMFSKENLKLEDDGPKPQEDFGDAANEKILQDVYILAMFLESHEKELRKSIKEVRSRLIQDKSRLMRKNTEANLVARTKTMMCPLHEECSDDIRPRWPSSSVKTISKFGHQCEFAHHTFELKFKQEVNAKRKMLNQTLDGLTKKLDSDYQRPPFNPGGNVFKGCIGCGEELRTKGVSKGICSSCQLRKGVNKKLQSYRQKAAMKYLKITQKETFQKNYEEKLEDANRLNTKLGYYRKACVLYDNQRYTDAFTYIAKAVEIVKEEKIEEEDKEQKKSDELKTKLGIDPNATITLDMLYEADKKDGNETSRSMDSQFGLSRAKLIAYAEKMGYIGEQKVDVNEFLNYQIQTIYLKIEKALQAKQKDIVLLQKKIEKLEGFDEEVEEKAAQQTAEGGFKSLSQLRREQQALKPKNKFDIDLVDDEKKIENLQKTIKYIQQEIEDSRPPEHWRPTRNNNIILDIDKYDEMTENKPKKRQGEKPKDISTLSKSGKNLEKSIYERDLDELIKLPNERSSPMKY